ncbi:ATPase V [Enterococcus plantarum]|uniref:V-type ATP synthase subunit C n=1 Tax=Enterococcus plantarum TaxID=1077675 RepID=A0A2W3ZY50_9ENTE|nr:V-type ATPase subunit [Enterococcus plantarum]OEG12551.1 ATPase V [Enterococcus plantarum]PZL73703.1 V-type ATP synthase subunit C [Enterococcus plantarum]
MKETAYNQINPLIRLKETELLSNAQYEQLVNAKNLDELKDSLKNTVYATYMTDDFAENFEYIYSKEKGKLYEWLYEMAPEPEVITIYTSRATFHNLKVLTKAELTGQNLDYLYIEDGRYSIETLKSAIRTRVSTELPQPLMKAVLEVLDYFQESSTLQAIDIIYDRNFLTFQRQLAEKLGDKDIIAEVTAFIDLTNISTMARGILQGQNENFLSTVLSSSGTIPKATFLKYTQESLAVFTDYVLSTTYSGLLAPIASAETKELDLIAFEKVKDDYLTSMYDKAKIMAFGPLPLLAFLNAKEVEWKNLRLILVSKRSNFPVEVVRERMRRTDDI